MFLRLVPNFGRYQPWSVPPVWSVVLGPVEVLAWAALPLPTVGAGDTISIGVVVAVLIMVLIVTGARGLQIVLACD
jgi:hypothetical protein